MLESFFVDRKPRRHLGTTLTLSAVVYAAGIAAAIVWSFWSVAKLTPRYVAVTWQPTAAPPPPPPPAAAPSAPAPVTTTRPPHHVPETPDNDVPVVTPDRPPSSGDPGPPTATGETPGSPTGVPDSTGDPTAADPPPPTPERVSIQTLNALRVSGDPMVRLPPSVLRALADQGVRRVDVPVRLCLSSDGVPTTVELLRSSGNPQGDEHIREAVRSWRYRAYQVNGRAVPVCAGVVFQYQID